MKEMETLHAQIMVGILIVQDVALGVMLGLMPLLDAPTADIFFALLSILLTVAGVLYASSITARYILPVFFAILEKTGSAELWVLGVVGVCFIASSITEYLGLSMETGAFLAGIMISLKGGRYA